MATYALMWRDSENVSGSFRTRAEALEAIRQALAIGQRDVVDGMTLWAIDRSGPWRQIASGPDLAALAEGESPRGSKRAAA